MVSKRVYFDGDEVFVGASFGEVWFIWLMCVRGWVVYGLLVYVYFF